MPDQAVAVNTIDLLQDSSFRVMFTEPAKYSHHLKALSCGFLQSLISSRKAVTSLQAQDTESQVQGVWFERLSTALERSEKVMKFIGSLLMSSLERQTFCEQSGLSFSPSEDVLWLAAYNGKQPLEKGLLEIATASQIWKRNMDELVKTADSSLRLQPEMERTLTTLKAIASGEMQLSLQKLKDLNEKFPQLLSGLRACDMENLKHTLH